jgi:predicted O-methyltransferase YrrM
MIQIRRDKFYRNSSEMYGGLVNMLLSLPLWMRNTIAIEIGSFIGESANILSLFFKEVVCIDPQGDDVFSGYKSDDIKRMFGKNTVQRNIRIILKRAEDAVEEFAQGSVGFVYVDGGHVYPCVHQDIINYYPKIMDGGYIGGHDYDNGIELCQGVKQAVDEIFGEPDYCFEDWSWLVKKVPGRTTIEG